MTKPKNVILTGATGMIGGLILQHCLSSDQIGKITSIVRKPSGVSHPKLTEAVCQDFVTYQGLEAYFTDQDIAYFCLGVYTGQVPDDEFKKITVDYVKGFADQLKQHSPLATMSLLSGQGADQKEKSRISFARYKGMAENYLFSQHFEQLYLFRPAYIYPVEPRVEPNFSYRLWRWLYPVIKLMGSNASVTSEELAEAMFKAGLLQNKQQKVLENHEIIAFLQE